MKVPNKHKGIYCLIGAIAVLSLGLFFFNELVDYLMRLTSHRFGMEPMVLSLDDYAKNANIILHGGLCILSILFLCAIQYGLLHYAVSSNKKMQLSRLAIQPSIVSMVLICSYYIFQNLRGNIISFLSYENIFALMAGLGLIIIAVIADFTRRAKHN
jgi:hypothetical protein